MLDHKAMISSEFSDCHMHTSFSGDSDTPPEEMIKRAIGLGLKHICITDHEDHEYVYDGVEFTFDIKEYFCVLENLREKYKDQIDIGIGVEIGLEPQWGDYYDQYVRSQAFDFVIGSVHLIGGEDPYDRAMFKNQRDEDAYRQTFIETLKDIQVTHEFDVLGHMDYVVRYGTHREQAYSYKKFADEIDEILKFLIDHGKGLELNTAGFKYGLPFAHPLPEILKRYRELGGEILTIGADAHKPEHIAYDFSKVKGILQDCGFKYYTEFRERKPVFKQVL